MNVEPGKGMATEAIHAGEIHDALGAHTAPIYQTSTFTFESMDAARAGLPPRPYMYPSLCSATSDWTASMLSNVKVDV